MIHLEKNTILLALCLWLAPVISSAIFSSRVSPISSALFDTRAYASEFNLESIHAGLANDYKTIKHLSATDLSTVLQTSSVKDWIIFDVREPDEFKVSHLKGAHLLSPSTWSSTFMKKYGKSIKGKHVLFYCSVGVRSSKMASYLKNELKQQGAIEVYNLKQGLFGWANEGKPMEMTKGTTAFIHPYNNHWGTLIKSKSKQHY